MTINEMIKDVKTDIRKDFLTLGYQKVLSKQLYLRLLCAVASNPHLSSAPFKVSGFEQSTEKLIITTTDNIIKELMKGDENVNETE